MISDDFWNVMKAINENVSHVARSDMKRRLEWLRDLTTDIDPPGNSNYRAEDICREIEETIGPEIEQHSDEDARKNVIAILHQVSDHLSGANNPVITHVENLWQSNPFAPNDRGQHGQDNPKGDDDDTDREGNDP